MSLDRAIAIVGMGGVFPQAPTLDAYWRLISECRDCAQEPPPGRWRLALRDVYDARAGMPDKVYSRKACFADAKALSLDHDLIDIPPALVAALDPLHTLLLYAGQEAFRDAALQECNRARAGVILGNLALPTETSSAWAWKILGRTFEEKVLGEASGAREVHPLNRYVTGLPAGILAKALGLGLGGHTLDAACASSLYAVKLAMDELLAGRADAMLAGGVSRPDSLYTQMGFSQLRALSPSGTSRPFDARGDGLVTGEGAGVFVLKRLADALRDGDTVHALIRGVGLSNDVGGRLLAPTSEGQLRAMRAAYAQAGWEPASVDLIECHATGTPVGDAVEFESLKQLWEGADAAPGSAVIGSVKSNIGHLLTAAGSAALMKTILALKHRTLPPSANFESATEALGLEASPFRVLRAPETWPAPEDGAPRRAAVSAFGFGGINAHVLVEEWCGMPATAPQPIEIVTPPRVAVVGMDARFGPWDSLRAFQERVLGGGAAHDPAPPRHWHGVEQSAWFRQAGLGRTGFDGYYIDDVPVRLDAFRIPPKEIEEMLPQQLLMLDVAAKAWADAGRETSGDMRAGVFLGLGLDLNTTNFHVRWALQDKARHWARQLDPRLSGDALDAWIAALRDASGPPLTANRTMGALASVTASRIARELRLGGPSFTLSSEESSGLQALRAAVRNLQDHTMDAALVGAVDFAGDVRAVLGAHEARGGKDSPVIGEGAAAVVLKRLEDAERDGDRIYAVIEGIGTASAGDTAAPLCAGEALRAALEDAYAEAGAAPEAIGYVECHGAGHSAGSSGEAVVLRRVLDGGEPDAPRCALGCVAADIGHTGAASGLAGIVKTCTALYQAMLPPMRGAVPDSDPGRMFAPAYPQPWLRNRDAGPRLAGVSASGIDGTCVHAVLSGYETAAIEVDVPQRQPLGARNEGLFVLRGHTAREITDAGTRLRAFAGRHTGLQIETLARAWWQEARANASKPLAAALAARNTSELLEQLAYLGSAMAANPGQRLEAGPAAGAVARDRVFYSPEPLAAQGKLAFVFPGSGNHFDEMGRELFCHWPEVLRRLDANYGHLRGQMQPDTFWNTASGSGAPPTHKAFIFGQVALGAAVSDLVRGFDIAPGACIGYSLGETAGLFSLGAWRARDEMLSRIEASNLFTTVLAGDCEAARRAWKLPKNEAVDWVLGVIDRPMQVAKAALKNRKKVYPLIANTLQESVIGGNRKAVEKLIRNLQCQFIPLEGVTTVHCEVVKEVEDEYRSLHLFETTPPPGVQFYSGAWGKAYEVTRESAADSVLAQAIEGVDYPRVIEQAYADGVRIFLELGPGNSCSRMIGRILAGKPHAARSVCHAGQDAVSLVLRGLAQLIAEGVAVDLEPLYGQPSRVAAHQPREAFAAPRISVPVGGPPCAPPKPPRMEAPQPSPAPLRQHALDEPALAPAARSAAASLAGHPPSGSLAEALAAAGQAKAQAHQAYLALSDSLARTMTQNAEFQMALPRPPGEAGLLDASFGDAWQGVMPASAPVAPPSDVFLERPQCLEFGIGKIAPVLGQEYAEVDTYPTRVRLPGEPLMLVDRIVTVEGTPRSLQPGRVVTEHDVLVNGWYLDGGRIPTCIAVEAGQADLFLSGYLGIDFQTKGLAMYRLLDAQVTFHGELPKPGKVIRYDIRIKRFFRHGNPWFFHFAFESTVDGAPLLTMDNGCAGFFTPEELDAGQGVVTSRIDAAPKPGVRPADWKPLVPMSAAEYSAAQLDALRSGNLQACFGEAFAGLGLREPLTIPGGRMRLVHRVTRLEPEGGRFGMGFIQAEADIHPDDWFLTCHFIDDKVMPGTLMYECCMHTFRVFLMRMGWLGEARDCAWQPVPGVASVLKCRGQVLETTRMVTYEVTVREIGYGPEPYALGDARMYADGKAIVDINHMSIRLTGTNRQRIEALWQNAQPAPRKVLYDEARIVAFTEGNPSEAFGDRYKPFDKERFIARLPRDPYSFLNRVIAVEGPPWEMRTGTIAEAEYDVPADAWYFGADRQPRMPFAVLLEVALQVCGWCSSYMGSALRSEEDLKYRNLGGKAIQHRPVTPASGRLTTRVKVTNVAHSGDMMIQHFHMATRDRAGVLYEGTTYFGFFSRAALADQRGVQDAKRYLPTSAELTRDTGPFPYPTEAPFPDTMMRMTETISCFIPDGGPEGLGFIQGTKRVNPEEWFFHAHFYQDPVNPGSLGLEAFLQLLKVVAARRWGAGPETVFESVTLGETHEWIYRGQVTPDKEEVTVEAVVTAIDDERRLVRAKGYLIVDGLVIYEMKDFGLRIAEAHG